MKTKKDIVEILQKNEPDWCDSSIAAALKHIARYPDTATLADIAADIPDEWAYHWALDIGDRKIMRDRVTTSEYAYIWALKIGDRNIMRDRVTDPTYVRLWKKEV